MAKVTAQAFVSREGHLLQRTEWTRLRADSSYFLVKEFENDKIAVSVEWLGFTRNANSVPRAHWKLYRLNVTNIVTTDGLGDPLPAPRRTFDPQLTREFRTEQEALDAYEDALVRFGGCEWLPPPAGASGPMFVEHGNKLKPPGPNEVDTRGMDSDIADLAGSW
jgi:hypothetical protein